MLKQIMCVYICVYIQAFHLITLSIPLKINIIYPILIALGTCITYVAEMVKYPPNIPHNE